MKSKARSTSTRPRKPASSISPKRRSTRRTCSKNTPGSGCEAVKLARKRKASLKPGAWNGKDDLNKVCSDLETLVKMRVAVKEVRMLVYIRTHLWVEAVKPLVPNVEKLSYYTVVNKLLPTLAFDPVELTGEISKDWLTFVRTTVERQLSDAPLSMAELDDAIKAHKVEIEKARRAKVTDEKQLDREQKAAETKLRKDRREAQARVSESLDKAIGDGHADPKDVVEIVNAVLADHKLALPAKLVGFDPATCTVADCKTLASALAGAGKVAEMKIPARHPGRDAQDHRTQPGHGGSQDRVT